LFRHRIRRKISNAPLNHRRYAPIERTEPNERGLRAVDIFNEALNCDGRCSERVSADTDIHSIRVSFAYKFGEREPEHVPYK